MRRSNAARTVLVAIVGVIAVVFAPAAQAANYNYTATVTPSATGAGMPATIGFSVTFPAGTDFPSGFESSTKYEIVLCPNPATSTFVDSFSCYAVSDAVQRNGALDNVSTGCPYLGAAATNLTTGGVRLANSGGTCQFNYSDFPVTVNIPADGQLPRSIRNNGGKARISVQSVLRYGDSGNVCVAGTPTGVGVDSSVVGYTGTCGTSPVASENPLCQPFCYQYNGTPRLVGEAAVVISGTTQLL